MRQHLDDRRTRPDRHRLRYTPAEYVGIDVRCVGGSVPTLSTAQIAITMHAPTSAGIYTSNAQVDPYNEIAESNESNNTAAVSFQVI